jgi:hypothetical protein
VEQKLGIIIALGIFSEVATAALTAQFEKTDLVVRDGAQAFRIKKVLDPRAFHGTVHAYQRRERDYFVVYGTSEWSQTGAPHGGYCGCGIESYIRWLHIRDGKILEQQEGLYVSCWKNRDGWTIDWRNGKLVWSTEYCESDETHVAVISLTWSYDPTHPEAGISETKSPTSIPKKEIDEEETSSYDGQFDRKRRILADFDGDGLEDMALSDVISELFTDMKGRPHSFTLYLKVSETSGLYRAVGNFWAPLDPFYLSVERLKEEGQDASVIWTYYQQMNRKGVLRRSEVHRDSISQSYQLLEFSNGEKCEASDILNNVFNKPRSVPVRWEQGIISNDLFKWVPLEE